MAKWKARVAKTGASVRLHFERGGDALNIELPGAAALETADAIYASCGKTSASKAAAAAPKGRKNASRTTGAGA